MPRTWSLIGIVVLAVLSACERRSETPPIALTTAALAVPPGFQDQTVVSGLTQPAAVRFAPDGRIFIAERSGLIKVFDPTLGGLPTVFADLRTSVHNFWDRGLLDLELHPDFPSTPYIYVLYTYDAALGGIAPRWGAPGVTADRCPTPPGPTDQGCVVSGRLSRFEVDDGGVRGLEQVLIENWPQQYPSHSIGALMFGPDGYLYASAGDGASFEFADYGQVGEPPNPLGDPPVALGTPQTPPAARGGAVRAQNVVVPGAPARFNGKVLRLDPLTGLAAPNNPLSDQNVGDAAAIVASGLRNPFRMTFRPGTNELWIGDVGWGVWEEIDRLIDPRGPALENFGWPCYEGAARQPGYEAVGLDACDELYASNQHVGPYYAYRHDLEVVPEDGCGSGQGSITGLAFYGEGLYGPEYAGALFFADYSRNCIWVMPAGADGLPDPSARRVFAQAAPQPVQLLIGPGNDLYYTSLEGSLHRIASLGNNQPPVAAFSVSRSSGAVPLSVSLDASASSDPDPGDTLLYAWDLDGDGEFDDATGSDAEIVYASAGERVVGLSVRDSRGAVATSTQSIVAGEPGAGLRASIDPGVPAQFRVGETVQFSGQGFDTEQPLPAASLQWDLIVQHCPTVDHCHPHLIESFEGVASGSFVAPEHDYPYHLELILRVSAEDGRQVTAVARLDPITVEVTLNSDPPGLGLALNQGVQVTPFTSALVAGSQNTISAPDYAGYVFAGWSDGGAQAHVIDAGAAATLVASYRLSPTPVQLKQFGSIIARVTTPTGGGNRSLEVIRDGDYPVPGTAEASRQYDTVTADQAPKDEWIGYVFESPHAFSSVTFQEGRNFVDGGWFEQLRVQVRRNEAWVDVPFLGFTPAYTGASDRVGFRRYVIDFQTTVGDAIRIYGPAGGSAYFVSVAELDVFGWRVVPSMSAAPLALIALPPALVLPGEDVALDARASFDPIAEPLAYAWVQTLGPAVVLADPSSPLPRFVAPAVTSPVEIGFTLTVSAGARASVASTVTLTVSPLSGPIDLTARGKPFISVPVPYGGGSRDLEIIRDGFEPAPGSSDSSSQFDTYAYDPGVVEGEVGYELDRSYLLGRVRFQEGANFFDGGWFDSLSVEIRRGGRWYPAPALVSTPAYPAANDGVGFETYELSFTPGVGDAVRVIGLPGGSSRFFSVAELRVYATPAPAGNTAPVADAGQDFAAPSGASAALDATLSIDPDGSALSYAWAQVAGPSVTLSDPTAAEPVFTTPVVRSATELTFSLSVRDGTDTSALDRVVVSLEPVRGQLDVTSASAIICSERHAAGGGNHDLEVIRDGVAPLPDEPDPQLQYDTYTGLLSTSGFVGYQLPTAVTFSQLVFQEGIHFVNGGWFTTIDVQVRRNGAWRSVSGLDIAPVYYGDNDGRPWQTYTFTFTPAAGDAIRLIGSPGGSMTFFSIAELRAYAL